MKTSINFKAVKSDSETHNFRKKTFDYIRKDLTSKNEYWIEQKIADRIQQIEAYCKEKSGRKLQKNAMPVREAVVVIKEDTTMLELQNLTKRLEEELNIRVFQIAIHKDEGHTDKDTKEWKPNYHAHLVADWQDLETGKTLKHQSYHYSKMQDLTAECLNMERGISGSKGRLEAIQFKIQQKEEDLKVLEERFNTMKSEMSSKKSEELIVKENDFLGFKKIKTDKTIANYEKAFRTYKSTILKNKTELESKSKQIVELNTKVDDLKKQVNLFKNKNAVLLSNPTVFASEKKKYLDSVTNILEREIKFSRYRSPNLDKTDKQKLISEMGQIAEKICKENNIPFSAINEVFKNNEMANQLFNFLRFGNNIDYDAENIAMQKKKKGRKF
ncbi:MULTISPECIES: hypothetical protein [Weeksellaceae]|nr:hypothetical protein [Chryseobacterium gleum]MCT4033112.1 hypothetical protein [Elizabethkingia anophelis]MCT4198839.1 hypothetical protein [Elizabethkingia anophelis]MCT4227082.1 hypothetical protein [Elizabethkingia anophelis]MCT4309509.1 hypothetical protein [Elizabethkingia anophelis]MDV4116577.1 hypothetical protein [Elizabethkingia anophelis]